MRRKGWISPRLPHDHEEGAGSAQCLYGAARKLKSATGALRFYVSGPDIVAERHDGERVMIIRIPQVQHFWKTGPGVYVCRPGCAVLQFDALMRDEPADPSLDTSTMRPDDMVAAPVWPRPSAQPC